jgi:DNA-binding transcriptional LysR family regulator
MHSKSLFRHLDLTTLKLLLSVHEEGTLTGGARREAIAVSAASKRLLELEQAIGMPLFLREARGMKATPAGATLLNHAREILRDAQQLGAELADHAQHARGYVRIAANLSAIVEFLPEDFKSFTQLHDGVKIDLQERPSEGVLQAVVDGAAELGICAKTGDTHGLYSQPYRRDRLVLALPEDHALARRARIRFADALDYPHVGLHADSWLNKRAHLAAFEAGKCLKIRIHVPGFDALCRMIQAQMGIGLMPYNVFATMGRSFGLACVELEDSWAYRSLHVVVNDLRQLSPVAQALFYHLAEPAEEGPAFAPRRAGPLPAMRLQTAAFHAM